MSDPLLDKMQNLMDKYQHSPLLSDPDDAEISGPAADGRKSGIPVLTDIVKLGDAVFHDQSVEIPAATAVMSAAERNAAASEISSQILTVVDAQLQNQIDALITPRLQRALDETLAVLLPQVVANIETAIRETLVEECARHGISLKDDQESV